MNRNVYTYLLLLLGALLVTSCNRGRSESGSGTLSLSCVEDLRINVKSDADQLIYSINVYNAQGDIVATFADHTAIDQIKLPVGTYRVQAVSVVSDDAPLGEPVYMGEKSGVVIKPDVTTNVTIETALANIKITAEFSQQIRDNFKKYEVTLLSGTASITFGLDDQGKVGYIPAPADGNLKMIIRMINNQNGTENIGKEQTFYQTITGAVARDYFRLSFDIEQDGSLTDGGGMFKLLIKTETDLVEHLYTIDVSDQPAPTISLESGLDLANSIIINADKRGVPIKLNIATPAAMRELTMIHNNSALIEMGIPTILDLCRIDPAIKGILNRNGITFSEALDGVSDSWIDFTQMFNTLGLGQYKIRITAYDGQQQLTKVDQNVDIMPDMDLLMVNAAPWAKFATLSGEWYTLHKPQQMTFEYTTRNSDNWTAVPQDQVTTDDQAHTVTARVTELDPSTEYRFRVVGQNADGVPYRTSNIISASTEAAPEIPNLSFDTWTKGGNNWYPNADAANSFWATGNEGVTIGIVGKSANTTPTDDAVKGQAAYMTTIKVPIVNVAAGNIFTGTFNTNIGNPASSAKMGRPYTGRPIGLRGWYKYTKVNSDKGHVYISLKSGSTQIAYGELVIDQTVSTYTAFEFKLNYTNTTLKPTEITVIATSSIGGANFVGEYGSTLWVDEFELLWD